MGEKLNQEHSPHTLELNPGSCCYLADKVNHRTTMLTSTKLNGAGSFKCACEKTLCIKTMVFHNCPFFKVGRKISSGIIREKNR